MDSRSIMTLVTLPMAQLWLNYDLSHIDLGSTMTLATLVHPWTRMHFSIWTGHTLR